MKKGGQFYLLAALIIIAIILGFVVVNNYVLSDSSSKLYDLKEELGIESEKVLDFGTMQMNGDNAELLEHFTTLYNEFAGSDKEIYYIFGNSEKILAYSYADENVGTISVEGAGAIGIDKKVKRDLPQRRVEGEEKVIVRIKEQDYSFDLKSGENFYFVIQQEAGGSQYVVTS